MLWFLFWLEIGMLPQGDFQVAGNLPTVTAWEAGYAELGLTVGWRGLEAGGGVKTAVLVGGGVGGFMPFSALYDLRAQWEWRGVAAGFRHYCYHPVLFILPAERQECAYMTSYEELYLRYEYGGRD